MGVYDPTSTELWKRVIDGVKAAKTQKVRGLAAIIDLSEYANFNTGHIAGWFFARAADVLTDARKPPVPFPFFLRPCPVRPRHGFVDSRKVFNMEEVLAVAREAVAADPDAELLATPFINGSSSAVLTPGSFSLGNGHDGATSGQSVTVYGPSVDLANLKVSATIKPDEIPYVELVANASGWYMPVQVRGGPPLQAAQDFVPQDTVVARVLVASPDMDLLKWERDVAEAGPGTVVYAPGLSLASHFCVHAVVNQVPVLTTREPVVGETLKQSGPPQWTGDDWKRLAAFVSEADAWLSAYGLRYEAAILGPLALHCAGQPAPATDAQLRLLAYGAVSSAKHLAAACIGEARHYRSTSEPKHNINGDLPRERMEAVIDMFSFHNQNVSTSRDVYYGHAKNASLDNLRYSLLATSYVYNYRAWRRGFGGKKWALITSGARKLCEALVRFQRRPSAETWAAVVSVWNVAIHREHNGKDTALNKFSVSRDRLNKCAAWPLAVLVELHEGVVRVIMDGPDAVTLDRGRLKLVGPSNHPHPYVKAIRSLALILDVTDNVREYKEAA